MSNAKGPQAGPYGAHDLSPADFGPPSRDALRRLDEHLDMIFDLGTTTVRYAARAGLVEPGTGPNLYFMASQLMRHSRNANGRKENFFALMEENSMLAGIKIVNDASAEYRVVDPIRLREVKDSSYDLVPLPGDGTLPDFVDWLTEPLYHESDLSIDREQVAPKSGEGHLPPLHLVYRGPLTKTRHARDLSTFTGVAVNALRNYESTDKRFSRYAGQVHVRASYTQIKSGEDYGDDCPPSTTTILDYRDADTQFGLYRKEDDGSSKMNLPVFRLPNLRKLPRLPLLPVEGSTGLHKVEPSGVFGTVPWKEFTDSAAHPPSAYSVRIVNEKLNQFLNPS